jgi:deoxyribose-phosphate aldolase
MKALFRSIPNYSPFIRKISKVGFLGTVLGFGITTFYQSPFSSLFRPSVLIAKENDPIQLQKEKIDQELASIASNLQLDKSEVLHYIFPHLETKKGSESKSNVDLGSYVDHTLLKPTATKEEIEQLCKEAQQYEFAAVCVNGSRVDQAVEFFRKIPFHKTKVAAVVGFPLGAMTSIAKELETKDLILRGADEIDMVINIGKLKDKDDLYILNDIKGVVIAANGRTVKVILECGALTKEEIIRGSLLSILAGADYIKTSTGFNFGGAKLEDVQLMKFIAGDRAKVKASGGVRSKEDAVKMIENGASRIGTSSGVSIVSSPASQQKQTPSDPAKY